MNDYTPSVATKQCTKCGEWKPCTPEYWYRQSAGKYGLNARCKKCTAEYDALPHNKKRRKEYDNKPEIKERARSICNSDEYREKQRQRNKTERRKQYRSQYSRSDRGKLARDKYRAKPEGREKSRQYSANRRLDPVKRAQDSAREKAYRQTPEGKTKNRIKSHNRRARERDLPNGFSYREWLECLEYWEYKCCVCGRGLDFWHIIAQEHWIPINDKRPDNPGSVAWNIVPMCHSMPGVLPEDVGCNNNKRDKDPVEWVYERYGKRAGSKILRRIAAYLETVKQRDND